MQGDAVAEERSSADLGGEISADSVSADSVSADSVSADSISADSASADSISADSAEARGRQLAEGLLVGAFSNSTP